MAKFTMLAALALGFGCSDKDDDSVGEGDADADTDSDTDTDSNPTGGSVAWGAGGATVDITGGSGSLKFGIVEQVGAKSWTAEDCIGGTYAGYGPFCHTVDADGSTTIACADTPDDVSNSATLFCSVVDANGGDSTLTYYFAAMDDSWCALSGPDQDYYSTEGCENWDM